MYAPIYLPQVEPPSAEIAAIERAIIDAEGAHHVDGRYFANDGDARQERRRYAARVVREQARVSRCAGGRFRLTTCVTPRERQQIDAASVDCVCSIHRDSIEALELDLARTEVDGALISGALMGRESEPALAAIVRGFPAHSIIGLIGEIEENDAIAASLSFGHAGIRAVVDVRTSRGWGEFRQLCDRAQQPDAFMRTALASVLREIAAEDGRSCSSGLGEFFRLAFSPRLTSAKELAGHMGVQTSTLMSKFFRAGVPSPKQYVAYARLIWAAHLGETPAMSISAIATRLNASSPQSFHRTVRTLTGMSAAAFRREFDGPRALDYFCARLVRPYRDALYRFDPVNDFQRRMHRRSASVTSNKATSGAEQGRAA